MKILGLNLSRLQNIEPTYGVHAHGLDVDLIKVGSSMWRAKARIGNLRVESMMCSTKEKAAAALDEGLRELWGAMAAILVESRA